MSQNAKAIAAMVFAMAVLAFTDALVKLVAAHLPVAQILVIISALGALGFILILKRQGLPLFPPAFFTRTALARNLSEAFAGLCMLTALAITPLTSVTAMIQAVPVLVTVGAVFVLKETVGLRRWIAVGIGLLGVLIILRPARMDMEPGLLLALGAAVGLASRDVLTRAVLTQTGPKDIHIAHLAAWGMAFNLPAGLILMGISGEVVTPSLYDCAILLITVISVMAGYLAVTSSVRMAEVSVVVPFRYARLPFGVLFGVWFFGETLDRWTIIGSAIIVAAGLYIMRREQKMPLTKP